MKIAAITCVRDEGDILDASLRHMLDQVDQLFVLDDGSSDDTPDILSQLVDEGLPLVWHRRDDPLWPQAQLMNDLAREAHEAGAEWIVPFDADEFWFGRSKSVREVIEGAPTGVHKIYGTVLHHLDWDRRFTSSHSPKVAYRWSASAQLAIGNHDVTVKGSSEGIVIRHVPYRSFEQFSRKTTNTIARLTPAILQMMGGWYLDLATSGITEDALKAQWDRYCSPAAIIDPIPAPKPTGLFPATTAIIIPLMRPARLAPLLENIAEVTTDYHVYVFGTGECYDTAAALASDVVTAIDDQGGTWPQRINRGYHLTSEPFLFTGQDDIRFHSGWLKEALAAMDNIPTSPRDGVVVVNDMWNPGGTMALVSRHYIQSLSGCIDTPNTVIYPGYSHNFSDNELFDTAAMRGRLIRCQSSRVEHLHPLAGKGQRDGVYNLGASTEPADAKIFYGRQRLWLSGQRHVPSPPNWPQPWPVATERMFDTGGRLVYPVGRAMDPNRTGLMTQTEYNEIKAEEIRRRRDGTKK